MKEDDGNHAATPEHWTVEVDEYGDEIWFGGFGCGLFTIHSGNDVVAYLGGDGVNNPKHIAHARLIAAAPELLVAADLGLQCARKVADLGAEDGDEIAEQIGAAIAKAKGD